MGMTTGMLAVKRGVLIDAQAVHVWHEFLDIRRMSAWFGQGHSLDVYEPQLGGRMELSVELDDGVHGFGGQIVVFEEGQELSFENNWFGERAWPVSTFVTLRLTDCYDGTLVELLHHGFERLGHLAGAEYLAYESGWDTRHLALLKEIVEGV